MRLLILLFAAGLAVAQDKPVEPKPDTPADTKKEAFEAEIIPVKTLTGDSFDRLMSLLSVFEAHVKGSAALKTIVVYAPKDVVAQMRRVVEQLDQPGSEAAVGKNIDMTLTLLRCSSKPPAADAPALPADMESVVKQLRNATQYKDIQLLDVIPMRLQEGRESRESLRLPAPAPAIARGTFTIHPEAVYRKDQARFVRFSKMSLGLQMPIVTAAASNSPLTNMQYTYVDVGFDTAGDFMEGQKTVLGKVSGAGEDDAIFAVITLKVLD
jgi:hypothetical protein